MDEPFPHGVIDRWIALSGLQKAIRRSDGETARIALDYLSAKCPAYLPKRLLIISFEDVGLGDPSLPTRTLGVVGGWFSTARKPPVSSRVYGLVSRMAATPKNRAVDFLYNAARYHPSMEPKRVRVDGMPSRAAKDLVIASDADPVERFLGLMRLIGVGTWFQNRFRPSLLGTISLGPLFERIGLGRKLLSACVKAAEICKDEFSLALPLVLTSNFLAINCTETIEVPRNGTSVAGFPYYFLDPLHTRVGARAIHLWKRSVPSLSAYDVRQLSMVVFALEGRMTSRTLGSPGLSALERLGVEADLFKTGISLAEGPRLMGLCTKHFDKLNEARDIVLSSHSRTWAAEKH